MLQAAQVQKYQTEHVVVPFVGDAQDVHRTLDMSGTVISKSRGLAAGTSLFSFGGACSRSIASVACTFAACDCKTLKTGLGIVQEQGPGDAHLFGYQPR